MGFATPSSQKVKATVSLVGFSDNKMMEIQKTGTSRGILTYMGDYELKKKSSTAVSVHHFRTGDGRVINESTLDKSIDKGLTWILNH